MTDKQKIEMLETKLQNAKEEILELNELLGLTKNRKEYMQAVKLWRKDTGASDLTYPDLGKHWEWALKYIPVGMQIYDAKGMLIAACKNILHVLNRRRYEI